MQSSCACMESKEKSRKYTDNGDSAKKDGKFVNAKLQRNVSNGRCRCCYGGASNADLMLDSTFENEDALKAYAVHPDHVAVADSKVRPYTKIRSCLDYEI